MPRQRAKSADQASLRTPGTTETPGAMRSPPRGLRGTPPSAIVYAVPQFIWGMSVETVPGKGWFTLLRLYSPTEAWFDKTWRPGEIELVK